MRFIVIFVGVFLFVQNEARPQNTDVLQLFQSPEFAQFVAEWQNRQNQSVSNNLQKPLQQTIIEPQKLKPKPNYSRNPYLTQKIKVPPRSQHTYHTNPFLKDLLTTTTTETSRKQPSKNDETDEMFYEQAENAHYNFTSNIHDGINDGNHQRQETREGLTVKGQYSYSDGFVKVTVKYEADDKGFRIVGEDREFIGNGPEYHPDGKAQIATVVEGQPVAYEITSDDIKRQRPDDVERIFL